RARGSAAATAADHREHERALAALARDALAVEESVGAGRSAAVASLYRRLARFIGENFVHMDDEECKNNAVLWRHYSDAELVALEQAIVASLTPEQKALSARWMVPVLNAHERAALLIQARRSTPAEAFAGLLASLRPHLTDLDWRKLSDALVAAA